LLCRQDVVRLRLHQRAKRFDYLAIERVDAGENEVEAVVVGTARSIVEVSTGVRGYRLTAPLLQRRDGAPFETARSSGAVDRGVVGHCKQALDLADKILLAPRREKIGVCDRCKHVHTLLLVRRREREDPSPAPRASPNLMNDPEAIELRHGCVYHHERGLERVEPRQGFRFVLRLSDLEAGIFDDSRDGPLAVAMTSDNEHAGGGRSDGTCAGRGKIAGECAIRPAAPIGESGSSGRRTAAQGTRREDVSYQSTEFL
jgi:hypothetical protein